MYLYPNNLRSKPVLWLWHLKDIVIVGILTLFAVFIYAHFSYLHFIVGAAVYAFLSLRFDDLSILDFILHASKYFILESQTYTCQKKG